MKLFLSFNFALLVILAGSFANPAIGKNPVFGRDSVKFGTNSVTSSFDKGLYKTTLDISKHHLSGFIFLKRTSDTSYRIIFSNQMGMKFFDFEFQGKKFIIHYCFPSLERKSLLKLLENDFRMLLFPFDGIKKIFLVNAADNVGIDFKVKTGTGKWLYRIEEESKRIIKIDSRGKFLGKIRIGIGYSGSSISMIMVSNPTIKLKLSMNLIS